MVMVDMKYRNSVREVYLTYAREQLYLNFKTFDKFYGDYEKNIEKLFQVVFNKVDDQLKMVGASEAGSTACVCFLRKEQSIFS